MDYSHVVVFANDVRVDLYCIESMDKISVFVHPDNPLVRRQTCAALPEDVNPMDEVHMVGNSVAIEEFCRSLITVNSGLIRCGVYNTRHLTADIQELRVPEHMGVGKLIHWVTNLLTKPVSTKRTSPKKAFPKRDLPKMHPEVHVFMLECA
jgi:hypothetical protein